MHKYLLNQANTRRILILLLLSLPLWAQDMRPAAYVGQNGVVTVRGGKIQGSIGGVTNVATVDLNIPVDATTYIFLDLTSTPTITSNQTGFPSSNYFPIATAHKDINGIIDSITDNRPDYYMAGGTGGGGAGTVTNGSGALTANNIAVGNNGNDVKVMSSDPTNCGTGFATGIDKTGAAKGCGLPPGGTVTHTLGDLTINSIAIGNAISDLKVMGVDPTNCDTGKFATGIDKTGAAKGCTAPAGGGNVSNSGTPASNQEAIWTNDHTIKGQDKDAIDVRSWGVDCTANTDNAALLNTKFATIHGKHVKWPNGCLIRVESPLTISGQDNFWIEGPTTQPVMDTTATGIAGCNGSASPVLTVNRSGWWRISGFGVYAKSTVACASSNFIQGMDVRNDGVGGYTTTNVEIDHMGFTTSVLGGTITNYIGLAVEGGPNMEQIRVHDSWFHCQDSLNSYAIYWNGANADNGLIRHNSFSGCFQGIRLSAGSLTIEGNQTGAIGNYTRYGANGAFIYSASCTGPLNIWGNEASDGGIFYNSGDDGASFAGCSVVNIKDNQIGVSDIGPTSYPINVGTSTIAIYTVSGNRIINTMPAVYNYPCIGSNSAPSAGGQGQLWESNNICFVNNGGNQIGYLTPALKATQPPFQQGEYHFASPSNSFTAINPSFVSFLGGSGNLTQGASGGGGITTGSYNHFIHCNVNGAEEAGFFSTNYTTGNCGSTWARENTNLGAARLSALTQSSSYPSYLIWDLIDAAGVGHNVLTSAASGNGSNFSITGLAPLSIPLGFVGATGNTADVGISRVGVGATLAGGNGTQGDMSGTFYTNHFVGVPSGGLAGGLEVYKDYPPTVAISVSNAPPGNAPTDDMVFSTFATGAWTGRWKITNANGHFLANTDNLQDIGGVAANRPRSGYFGTSLTAPTITATSITASSGTADFSATVHSLPMKVGTNAGKPGTCATGELYFATDLTAGQQILECDSTNHWTQQLNTGGGTAFGGGSGSSFQDVGLIAAPANPAASYGRLWIDSGDNLFHCKLSGGANCLGASSSAALNTITQAAATNSINNADYAQTWNWQVTTAAKTAFTFGENVASTSGAGSQYLLHVGTLSGSTAKPIKIDNNGNGVEMSTTGALAVIGTGTITATSLSSTLGVAGGGTGLATLSAHALYAGNGTGAPTAIGPDASTTKALFSAGSSADPAFRAIATTDLPAALASQTSVNGTSIPASATLATAPATLTAGGILYGGGTTVVSASAAGTAKQLVLSGGAGTPTMVDFPDVKVVPAANCNNVTGGAGWSLPTSGAPTVACRTGTNVQAGVLQFAQTNTAQFQIDVPGDWDSSATTYAKIYFTQGANTTASQTIIMQIQTGCASSTDDPTFNGAQSFATANTTTTAHTAFTKTLSALTMTGCTAGQNMNVKILRSGADSAGTAPNVYWVAITFPRLLTLQAN